MTRLFFVFFATSYVCGAAVGQQELVRRWNDDLDPEAGQFQLEGGDIVYTESGCPLLPHREMMAILKIPEEYGVGGVHLFKKYTATEFAQLPAGRWSEKAHYVPTGDFAGGRPEVGYKIVESITRHLGKDFFKINVLREREIVERADRWGQFIQSIIPSLLEMLINPRYLFLLAIGVFLIIGLPILLWNSSKAIMNFIFGRRPTIITEKDTDIYISWWKRLFWRPEKLPKVIVNDALSQDLDRLIRTNSNITQFNRTLGLVGAAKRKKYQHILAYGVAGVGKTLFAKKLAQESGMHFIYITAADLFQMPQDDALMTLKNCFAYARRQKPTVFIIDEADRLFENKLMATLVQKEFPNASDSNIQLFLITNHPDDFPLPIISRVSKVIPFDIPSYSTKKKLFEYYLDYYRVKNAKKFNLSEDLLSDLVGRDIEAICLEFSNLIEKERAQESLAQIIVAYINKRNVMTSFRYDKKNSIYSLNTPPHSVSQFAKTNKFYIK